MDASRQVFKFKGEEFNLDFIEFLHKNGQIKKNDVIQIAERPSAPFKSFTLETLQKRHGEENPFRRNQKAGLTCGFSDSEGFQSDESLSIEDKENKMYIVNSPPAKIIENKPAKLNVTKAKSTEKLFKKKIEKRLAKTSRFPLIFDPNEKEKTDNLTNFSYGFALKNLIQKMKKNKINELDTLLAPLVKKIGYPTSCKMCETPLKPSFNPILAHIVSDQHYEKLRTFGFYERDYQFLVDLLKSTEKIPERKNVANPRKTENPTASKKDHRFPLIFDPSVAVLEPRKPFKNGERMKKLFHNIDEPQVDRSNGFFKLLLDIIGWPKKCDLCNEKLAHTPYSVLIHLSSNKHIESLKTYGYNPEDYEFWCRVMHGMKEDYICRKSKLSNIPLMFNPRQESLEERETFKNGDALRRTLKETDMAVIDVVLEKFFKRVGDPKSCELCTTTLESKPSIILTHLVSDEHFKNLRIYGFYMRDYMFWIHVLCAINSKYNCHSAKGKLD